MYSTSAVKNIHKIITVIILFIITIFLTSSYIVSVSPDSYEYMDVAKSFVDGSFLTIRDTPTTDFAFYHRSPFYCFLLSLLIKLNILTPNGIIGLHSIVTFFCTGVFLVCMVGILSPYFFIVPFAFITIALKHITTSYFFIIGTQWIAIQVLLMWVGLMYRFIYLTTNKKDNFISFIEVSLTCSVLILLRSALSCFILIPFFIIYFTKEKPFKKLITLLVCVSPVFMWSLLNHYRYNTYALSPSLGWQIGTMGSIIGGSPVKESDEQNLKVFKERLNSQKFPSKQNEEAFFEDLKRTYKMGIDEDYTPFTFNFTLMHGIRKELNLTFLQMNKLAFQYAKESISLFPIRYLRLFIEGISVSTAGFIIIILQLATILITLIHKKNNDLNPLRYNITILLWITFIFHIFHAITCSLVQLVVPGYYLLTLLPWFLIVYIYIVLLVKKILHR